MHTRQQLDTSIQAYADAYKSGNPNLIRLAVAPLQAMLQSLPESWGREQDEVVTPNSDGN